MEVSGENSCWTKTIYTRRYFGGAIALKHLNNMYAKIFSWILLLAGLLLIGWTLVYSYNIFTAKSFPPEFFKPEQKVSLQGSKTNPQDIQTQIEKIIGEQLKGLLPADTLPKVLNLTVWSMLAFVLIAGGGQISSIGIKLMKKQ